MGRTTPRSLMPLQSPRISTVMGADTPGLDLVQPRLERTLGLAHDPGPLVAIVGSHGAELLTEPTGVIDDQQRQLGIGL